ncbi:MAG TPA: hydantoinase/oxoprolinase family protein [Clostridiales bacterium]|nr:hydantoinase/oxoprolinase family protein [Clostridiales bacterium]
MSTVLGIDTGGTFTDGVIIDLSAKKVLAAVKSPTTHQDLMIGIRETIQKLSAYHLDTVSYVGISTTLATNAIVENRGCRVGLLLLGYESEQELPQCECYVLPGKFNIRGEETEPLDLNKTREAIEELRHKVDAVAISGICSVRNQEHEETVKNLVREILEVPVVTAHELSTALGVHERTVTCVLNARLVFVIDSLLHGVKQVLSECGLAIPIMVVKGDGSLMNETITRERPIETILSGPAASIIGAIYLNGSTDGLVLDMGGTTTDIAILKHGLPRLDAEGAKVGGWKTRVAAVEVTTSGLGGDSRIRLTQNGEIKIGPRRNWPVSVICKKYPAYLEELEYAVYHPMGLVFNEAFEGYFLLHPPSSHLKLTEIQRKVIEAVADAPHTITEISRRIGVEANLISFDDLLDHGILGAVGFTPTDVLCLEGLYRAGNGEGAAIAGNILAKKAGLSLEDFIFKAKAAVTDKLCRVILDSALTYEKVEIDPFRGDKVMEYFFRSAIWGKADALVSNGFHLGLPVIGIGAPTRFWLPEAAKKFQTKAVFPEYHHVANAVGAAVGKVMTIFHVVVQNHEAEGVYIYAPWGQIKLKPAVNKEDQVMERAVSAAIAKGKAIIAEEMRKQKIEIYDILVDRKDSKVRIGDGDELCIETCLEIVAAGHLENMNQASDRKSLLGAFWGKGKAPDYSKLPTVT